MNIIGVIVDELPDGCYVCSLMSSVSEGDTLDGVYQMCLVTEKTLTDISRRSNLCPLMTLKRQLELWKYAETGNWDGVLESEE